MTDHQDQHLDPAVAAAYDERHADRADPDLLAVTVERLRELAGDGRALELAIGTGRVALPLVASGVEVHGIELSEPMLAQLRAKPDGADIPVVLGDMTTATAPGTFSLVYLVFNTIGNLTTQDAQVACFRNAADHLRPGGCFLVEVGVPEPPSRTDPTPFRTFAFTDDHIGVDEYLDPIDQTFASHHYRPTATQAKRVSGRFRYVWPAELDLMAALAGMHRVHRWEDWHRTPFTYRSAGHVSVWRRPE